MEDILEGTAQKGESTTPENIGALRLTKNAPHDPLALFNMRFTQVPQLRPSLDNAR